MFSVSDTIVAIATPPGRGGIGVVRLSGPDACAIARQLVTHRGEFQPRHATFTSVVTAGRAGGAGRASGAGGEEHSRFSIDHAVVTFFPAPHSYTGDDVVEVSAHGSPVVLREIVDAAMACGARLAEPGEFTLRAVLNGRLDLLQAEAVADLIDAATPLQARAAFDQLEGTLTRAIAEIDAALFDLIARLEASVDFPDEGYHFTDPQRVACDVDALIAKTRALLADARRGRLLREGLQIAIVGRPNVGKSSLFNALAGASRAIVHDVAGTTRDLVTEVVELEGLRVTLVDTAGLRETSDPVELEGVARARQAIAVCDLVIQVVVDDSPQRVENKQVIARNKADLRGHGMAAARTGACHTPAVIDISATTGAGLTELTRAILTALDVDLRRDRPAITNLRHVALVERAQEALVRGRDAARAAGGALSEEFVLADLQEARSALEEISGRRAPEDLLAHIFSRFCIGK